MKKLSKKELNHSFLDWFYGHLTCFSQEHMLHDCHAHHCPGTL